MTCIDNGIRKFRAVPDLFFLFSGKNRMLCFLIFEYVQVTEIAHCFGRRKTVTRCSNRGVHIVCTDAEPKEAYSARKLCICCLCRTDIFQFPFIQFCCGLDICRIQNNMHRIIRFNPCEYRKFAQSNFRSVGIVPAYRAAYHLCILRIFKPGTV